MPVKHSYSDDFHAITSSKSFCFCVLLTALAAFGFATSNMAVSVDDLQGYLYTGIGNNMLASGRFTIYLVDHLTSSTVRGPVVAYINDIIAIVGMVWASINFCILFRRVCGDAITNAACTVFTCFFISYPLITELWEYIGAYRVVAFGFVCDSFVLLLMFDVIHKKASNQWKSILISCILMMLVSAGYESLIPVYIFCVCAVLCLQVIYGNEKEKTLAEIIRQGLCYAGILVIGLVLRIVVHKIILFALQIEPAVNGDTVIRWGSAPFLLTLIRTLWLVLRNYVLQAIIYFPLTELVVAALFLFVIGMICGKRYGWAILLPGFGMYLSLIILCLVQGFVVGYRACQVFSVFVAFTAMIIVLLAERQQRPWLRVAVLLLCGYLCFHQANQTNYYLTLNYLRSEEELHVVRDIGEDLQENFDMDKPVVFVGSYHLRPEIVEAASIPEDSVRWQAYRKISKILERLFERMNFEFDKPDRKLTESNVLSVISFGMGAFNGSQEPLQRLFSFAGYDYIMPRNELHISEAKAYVEEYDVPSYPKAGYITDVGEYIIVHLH